MDATLIFRAATLLLTVAFFSGLVMAGIRFGSDRQSPPWLAKLHGFAAVAALSLLVFAWFNTSFSNAASFGLIALLLAAAAGLLLNLGYHWQQKPLPEGLVFGHMSVAFVGFLLVFIVML